ncbi:MAG: hypothetical protein ACRDRW_11970 [Pseudonocardiaceae bacterium]
MGAEVKGDVRGGEVIYPGPARIVLAAAAQLRDPDLTERYSEEWLANLQGRAHLQQWRDAVSLLLRGARATRWARHGTNDSRPRVVVASSVTMALIAAAGTVLLLVPMTTGWGLIFSRRIYDLLILCVSLTAAGTTGLVLLTRRPWRTVLAWLTAGVFATFLIHSYTYSTHFYLGIDARFDSGFSLVFYGGSWWLHIVSGWALYAALTLFVYRKPSLVMRALAAADILAILRCITPVDAYFYANRIGLVDLIRLMSGPLNVDKGTAFQVAPGIVFLLSMLVVVAAWRCVAVAQSLIRPARCGPSGARMCPR